MKATIISDKVVVHIAFCLSEGKYKCLSCSRADKKFLVLPVSVSSVARGCRSLERSVQGAGL